MKKILTVSLLLILILDSYSQTPGQTIVKAISFANQGNYDSALYMYDLAITISERPELPMLHVLKGEFLANKNRRLTSNNKKYFLALAEFDKAINIDSTFYPAYSSRGLLNIFNQKFNLAIKDFSTAIKYALTPEEKFNALADLGSANLYLKNYEGAILAFNKASEIKPNEIGILINLATLHMNLKNYSEAKKLFQQAVEIDSVDVNLLNNLALLYIEIDDYEGATKILEKAIDIDPNEPYAYNNLGLAKAKTGNLEQALELINRSLEIYPENAYAFKNRAFAYIEMGMIDNACNDLLKANQLGYSKTYDEDVNEMMKANCDE